MDLQDLTNKIQQALDYNEWTQDPFFILYGDASIKIILTVSKNITDTHKITATLYNKDKSFLAYYTMDYTYCENDHLIQGHILYTTDPDFKV